MSEVEERVRGLVAQATSLHEPLEAIGGDDRLSDVGVDSLGLIRLIVAIEREFDFDFDDEGLGFSNSDRFGDLIAYVEEHAEKA